MGPARTFRHQELLSYAANSVGGEPACRLNPPVQEADTTSPWQSEISPTIRRCQGGVPANLMQRSLFNLEALVRSGRPS